jgi:hypothetical protein
MQKQFAEREIPCDAAVAGGYPIVQVPISHEER